MRSVTRTPSDGAPEPADPRTPAATAAAPAPPAPPTASGRTGPSGPSWAYVAGLLTLLGGLGWVVLALTHLDDPVRSPDIRYDAPLILLGFGLSLSGLFVLAHRSDPSESSDSSESPDRSGRALGSLLLLAGCTTCLSRFLLFALAVGDAGPVGADLGAAVLITSATIFLFTVFAVPLWFPDGRLPRRWGPAYAAVLLLWSFAEAYDNHAGSPDWYGLPNPLLHGVWARAADQLAAAIDARIDLVAPLLVLASLTVAAVRWRRSPNARPQQGVALLPYVFWLVVTFFGIRIGLSGDVYLLLFTASSAVWPLAVGYAFTRDRSWYLDRATRRVLTSFTLVGAVVAGWFLLALELPRLLPGASNADAQLMAGCALAVGVLLRPTVHGVSRAVERFYYGQRAHPYQVVRELAERLSRAVEPGDAPPLLCETVVRALGLPGARVTLDTRGGTRELAVLGAVPPQAEAFPLSYQGTVIGALHAPPRSGETALDRQDRAVLGFLADQASPAVASLRLSEDLQASRKQIVLAREEERKRLRHDLHDGLGPALSGLRLQVDTARAELPDELPAAATLRAASTGIGAAISELRRITDGLAPAELGKVGLADALRQLAGRLDCRRLRVAVELDPDPLPTLPAAVEVAVYRISGEALNNVLRHSGAARARLTLRVGPDQVTVEASDDGNGFPSHHGPVGVGLRSMAERAEELGGSFSAVNDVRGALVRAVLPRGAGPAPSDPGCPEDG